MTDVIAVIPAAGAGVRMEAEKNKAFLSLAGESIIRRTVKAFLAVECISEIYIMVNPLESKEMHNHLSGLANPYQTKIEVVPGGETRQDSVISVWSILQIVEVIHQAYFRCRKIFTSRLNLYVNREKRERFV